jgi:Ca-activated chloride channel family protein
MNEEKHEQTAPPQPDATMITPTAEATVISSTEGDATVITAVPMGDSTVIAQQPIGIPVAELNPRVEMEVRTYNPYALAKTETMNYVMVSLASWFEGGLTARSPLSLSLVIDKSGSMEGKPMEQVKLACKYIVDSLTPSDLLSIITFDEVVDVVMPQRRVINKDLIKQHIDSIRPRGTTNLFGGITAGCQQIASIPSPAHLKRVLLLTDGEANEGITDFQSMVSAVRSERLKGISFSTLGVGIEYNEELMMSVAKNSAGNYYYIDQPEKIPDIFKRELDSLFKVVAKNVRLSLDLKRDVEVKRAFGLEPMRIGRRVEFTLPDLENEREFVALIEVGLLPHPPGKFALMDVDLSFEYFGSTFAQTLKQGIVFQFATDRSLVLTHINADVADALKVRDIVANLQKAGELMKKDVGSATMIITQAQTMLMSSGRTDDATLVGVTLEKLKSGQVDDATKSLSGAVFDMEAGKSEKKDV